jgi:hypothetical protein
MDDFVVSNLQESRNEWCARLVSIFTPLVIEGFRSIFNESWKMCLDNDEISKYLMTFQNLLCRIPKWNSTIIEEERKRIIERSSCNYLEDLITCVHIIQLKVLTSIRVGNKQKKIDISIPKLDHFVHKVYVHAARKIYSNVYLFEKSISPLQLQKNNRELELLVQECIMITIRDSIPTESIIRAYLDESIEQEEEVTIENLDDPNGKENKENKESKENNTDSNDSSTNESKEEDIIYPPNKEEILPEVVPSIKNIDNSPVVTRLTFNDTDNILESDGNIKEVSTPKTIENLEKISMERTTQRKLKEYEEEDDSSDDENGELNISDEVLQLNDFDFFDSFDNPKKDDNISLTFDEL